MSDAKLKLQARKDSVDITKIALQGGVYAGLMLQVILVFPVSLP